MSESQAAANTPIKSILAAVVALITTVVLSLTGGDKKDDPNQAPQSQSPPNAAHPKEDAPKKGADSTANGGPAKQTKQPAKPQANTKSRSSTKPTGKQTAQTKRDATPRKRSRFDRSTSTGRNNRSAGLDMPADGGAARIEALFKAQRSDAIVTGRGTIHRILRDDNEGSRHQKWILELSNNRTILFAHNIDLAPRVPLDRGDEIEFRGEYEFNDRGGVVHWTHHDPRGRHEDGFIRHRGKTYK